MGEGVRGEGSAVTVFFLSLLLLTTPPPAHQTPPRGSRLNLVRGCLSNTQKKPPANPTSRFSVEFGARVSLKHTKKTASYEHYLLF